MKELPEGLYRATDIRTIDRRAGATPELAGGMLMERAGASAYHLVRAQFPRARRLVVVCGPGNNGGDGYVLARLAREQGLDVKVLTVSDPATLKGDAQSAFSRWQQAGGTTQPCSHPAMASAEVIVDALFGTGLDRAVDGPARTAIESINSASVPVVALDIASGLEADTGRVLGEAVHASVTVSFVALKAGLFTADGQEYSGRVCFDDLQIPAGLYAGVEPFAHRLTPASLTGRLRPRPRHFHKGQAGRVLVVGGHPGMPGAVRLAGEAAYRAGAGLVVLATHPSHAAQVSAACPELICHGMTEPGELEPLLSQATAVVLGPGLGQDAWSQGFWSSSLNTSGPMVIDADALNLLATAPRQRADWVLTPHPGEAARLLDTTVRDIEADRWLAAQRIAARYGGVCVLKGSGTVIATHEQVPVWVCDRGNPAMATGGSGDVLSGAIGALLAQGLSPLNAAQLGVYAHAAAGDRAAQRRDRGMLARDLLLPMRDILNELAHAS